MTEQEEKIVAWCKSKVGCGYAWGATGQVLTERHITALQSRYGERVRAAVIRKWLGKQVYDCATFARSAMRQAGIRMVSGASSQWKRTPWAERGTIDTLPAERVCCLYRTSPNANPMQHVGVYLGNGRVIDARGSQAGVIERGLQEYPWTHWGIPEGFGTPGNNENKEGNTEKKEDKTRAHPQTMEKAFGKRSIGINKVRHGNAVRNVQLCVIDYANDTSNFVDGSFGNKTMQMVKDYQAANGFAQVDGVVGKLTMQSLWRNYESRLKAQG